MDKINPLIVQNVKIAMKLHSETLKLEKRLTVAVSALEKIYHECTNANSHQSWLIATEALSEIKEEKYLGNGA